VTLSSGDEIDVYNARDALVLKVLTMKLTGILLPSIPMACYHVKGRGGLKGALRKVISNFDKFEFVFRTDVKSYYESIPHQKLLLKLSEHVADANIMDLVWQYLNRTVQRGGIYFLYKQGLPIGSSLSPLLGAFYLRELDKRMERLRVFYVRFMDDILIMAKTRWQLRNA